MTPSKSDIPLSTISTVNVNNPEQETRDKNNESKVPTISSRQNAEQKETGQKKTDSPANSSSPEIVVRRKEKQPEKILIADGVWLREPRKIENLIKNLNHESAPEQIQNNNNKEISENSKEDTFFEFGKNCFSYFKYLEFESDEKKFEFFLSLAKNDPWRCAMYFDQSSGSNPEYIFQIAMVCAEHKRFINYYDKFKLISESHRLEISKKFCSKHPELFVENLHIFDIKDEPERVKLALYLAKLIPEEVSKAISEFNITDENSRREIALLCGKKALDNLPGFNLRKKSRTQLAFDVINDTDGHESICAWIKNLNLPREDRAKLALRCAAEDGTMLAEHIADFNITDENIRFSLAKKCLNHILENQRASIENLANFKLSDPEKYQAIIRMILLNLDSGDDWNFLFEFVKKSLHDKKSIQGLIEAYLIYKSIDSDMIFDNEATDLIKKLISESKNELSTEDLFKFGNEDLESEIEAASDFVFEIFQMQPNEIIYKNESNNEDEKNAMVKWVRDVLFYVENLTTDNPVLLNFIIFSLKNIKKFNDVNYRDFLTENIFSSLHKLPLNSEIKEFTSVNRWPLFITWPFFTSKMHEFFMALPRSIIQNGYYQRSLIEAVCSLKNSGLLQNEIKNILFKLIPDSFFEKKLPVNSDGSALSERELKLKNAQTPTNPENIEKFKQILTCLSKIRVITSFGEEDLADRINDIKDLDRILQNIAITSFNLSNKEYQKFSSVFYNYRNEMSLLVYLSRIKNTHTATYLKEFVHLVLNDEFLAKRYERSEILRLCDKNLQAAWKLNTILNNEDGSTYLFTDNHEDFINMGIRGSCQRVDGDPSLNRGVIGAAMDGSEKLCVLKNTSGDILQRCILRLMWVQPDPTPKLLLKEGKPCIFIENIYPPNLNAASKIKLINFAYAQGSRLNLPVALTGRGIAATCPKLPEHYQLRRCVDNLLSGEIYAPIYSDAMGGIQHLAFFLYNLPDNALTWISPHRPPGTQ